MHISHHGAVVVVGGGCAVNLMEEKNQDMSYSCSYSPPDDTGDIFQS